MDLYLIRHGLAGESGTYTNDAERPLTEDGKKKTRQVAKRLVELGLTFDLMLTSPFVRARQTAELLLEAGLCETLEEATYLAPNGDITTWVSWLATWQPGEKGSLALVGHEPNLSAWAEILIRGDAKGGIELKKAGVIGLSLPDNGTPIGRSRLFWLVPPRLLLK
jgi:phosphohistidine phosphatase